MVEGRMMTPADVVARAMGSEHGDLLRDAVGLVVRELMDAEVATLTAPNAASGRPSASRISTGTGSGRGRRGSVRSSFRSTGRGRGRRTFRRFLSRGGVASRRSSAW